MNSAPEPRRNAPLGADDVPRTSSRKSFLKDSIIGAAAMGAIGSSAFGRGFALDLGGGTTGGDQTITQTVTGSKTSTFTLTSTETHTFSQSFTETKTVGDGSVTATITHSITGTCSRSTSRTHTATEVFTETFTIVVPGGSGVGVGMVDPSQLDKDSDFLSFGV